MTQAQEIEDAIRALPDTEMKSLDLPELYCDAWDYRIQKRFRIREVGPVWSPMPKKKSKQGKYRRWMEPYTTCSFWDLLSALPYEVKGRARKQIFAFAG